MTSKFFKQEPVKFNGWANWKTWNVALWIQNTEEIYNIAKQFDNYKDYVNLSYKYAAFGNDITQDGVRYNDPELNIEELDQMIKELS